MPCDAKNPLVTPGGAFVCIAVGVSVQGDGSEPLHRYDPPATIGTDVGAGDGDDFGSEQILYAPPGFVPQIAGAGGGGVDVFFEPLTLTL